MDNTTTTTLLIINVVTFILSVGAYVWVSLALTKVFAKLGQPAWKAWVPVVNIVTIFQLGGQNPLWLLATLIPGVGLVATVFGIIALNNVNKRFGQGPGFTVLAVLLLPVWASILGFGKAAAVDPNAIPVYEPVSRVPYGAPPIAQPPRPPMATATPGVPISAPPIAAAPIMPPPPPPPAPAAPIVTAAPVAVSPFAPGMPGGPSPIISAAPGLPSSPPPPPPAQPLMQPYGHVPSTGNPWAPPGTPVASTPAPPAPPAAVAPPAPPAPVVAPTPPAPPAPPAPAAVSYAAPVQAPAPPTRLDDDDDLDAEEGRTMLSGRAAHDDDDDEGNEHTVVVGRRAKPWILTTDDGQSVTLNQTVALLGRNPTRDRSYPDAQLVPLNDSAKTVSKTHARIELIKGTWQITDLDSTNGVVLFQRTDESELQSGVPAVLTERFLLGELPVRIHLEA